MLRSTIALTLNIQHPEVSSNSFTSLLGRCLWIFWRLSSVYVFYSILFNTVEVMFFFVKSNSSFQWQVRSLSNFKVLILSVTVFYSKMDFFFSNNVVSVDHGMYFSNASPQTFFHASCSPSPVRNVLFTNIVRKVAFKRRNRVCSRIKKTVRTLWNLHVLLGNEN